MTWRYRIISLLLAGLTVTACGQVNYVDHTDPTEMAKRQDDQQGFGRQVDYHLSRAFYETPPACVMILPTQTPGLALNVRQMVDAAVSRHVGSRIDKVMGARRIAAETRNRALDAADKGDRRRLGRALACDSLIEIETVGVDSVYAVIWTDISVGMQLTLRRARDGEVIWRGKHQARRSDGGLPLTIFGAGGSVFAAGRLANDPDTLPSMIEDSVRRMMASLPDIRRF